MAIYRELILASDKFPSLPGIALQVINLTNDPEADIRDIIRIIKNDPALAAKILRTINSSLFGLRHQVGTIEQAITLLGPVATGSLVLSFSLLPNSTQRGPVATQLYEYWRSSLTQAVVANELVKLAGGGTPAEYFIAGLLQDVGSLALLRTVPDEYLAVLEEYEHSDRLLIELEQERLGLTHLEISCELFRRWRLPDRIRQAVAGHHVHPADLGLAARTEHGPLQIALATGSAVATYFWRTQKRAAWALVLELFESHYGMDEAAVHPFLERATGQVRQAAELFALDPSLYPPYEKILASAKAELVNIACRARCDLLTGVCNRTNFEDQLACQWLRAAEVGETIGILLVDLDSFTHLNTTCGTPFGDKVLRAVARVLEQLAPAPALVARHGGDKFVLLFAAVDEPTLSARAEEARRAIACRNLRQGDHVVEATASVGAVLCSPRHCKMDGPRELLDAASAAVSLAKRNGGNQFWFLPLVPAEPVRCEVVS